MDLHVRASETTMSHCNAWPVGQPWPHGKRLCKNNGYLSHLDVLALCGRGCIIGCRGEGHQGVVWNLHRIFLCSVPEPHGAANEDCSEDLEQDAITLVDDVKCSILEIHKRNEFVAVEEVIAKVPVTYLP